MVIIELPAGTCSGELVGLREVHEYRGDVPPFTARRTFPIIVRAPIDELSELGVLRSERDQDVNHGARLGASGSPGLICSPTELVA